ncbi:MAG: zinc ribbon domain-containing protein, partial [Deltaproteobacteria bacterium]|nr:zinc ribbon domain-containing protein [Deltaproteobacteria bacterium]
MECPKCKFQNRDEAKFCKKCGLQFAIICPQCNATNTPDSAFCEECGYNLTKAPPEIPKSAETIPVRPIITDQERKYVTILFSDLSGYTAMTEKLDPEEVKEIMGRIFGEIALVVVKYEGFIEKYVGDAILAL